MARCKVLIVGSTGYIGRHLATAALRVGHQLFLLARPSREDAYKSKFLDYMEASGATLLQGSLEDYDSLLDSVKRVDVVVSAVSWGQLLDQLRLIEAIREAGTVKRFLPSEFGGDPDRIKHIPVLDENRYGKKVQIRRAIEAAGIPFTYVCSNCFAGLFIPNLCQLGSVKAPEDKVIVFGDGNSKAIFVDEDDVGVYTMRCIDDPRTRNKTMFIKPPENVISQNELIALWEKLNGKHLQKQHISSEELLNQIEEATYPDNVSKAFAYSIFVRGDQVNFEIAPTEVEATELYPDVKYTTVAAYTRRSIH